MQEYWLLLAKLPFVIAALGWAVRELIMLERDKKRDTARSSAETGDGVTSEGLRSPAE